MKKKLVMMTVGAAFGLLLAGCGPTTVRPGESSNTGGSGDSSGGTSEDVSGKSILSVATYDGGIGSDWLRECASRFEKKYAEASFETGKTGVSVKVLANKSYNGTTLLNNSLTSDVYFTEDVSYYEHVAKNNFADITTLVTSPLSEFGETESIKDKIDAQYVKYLTAKDGKYYAIPFYDGIYGIIYDVDLFTSKNYFFASDGGFVKSATTTKSNGPDGVAGTSDDGLPATYAEFTKLCTKIRGAGDTPFSYSGQANEYVMRSAINFWSDYEGLDQMNLNYTLDGEANLVKSVTSGVVTTEKQSISDSNGYLLQKQAGKYYALSFLKDVFFGDASNYKVDSSSHLDAETNFIRGSLGFSGATEYAMHFDGSWWENESTATFENLKKMGYAGKTERNFAFMSIPSPVTAPTSEHKQTLLSQNNSYCFINKNSTVESLAEKFVAFAHTDSELGKFTAKTSVTRALSYDVAESDLTDVSSYCKSVIALKKNSNIIYPFSSVKRIMNNVAAFSNESWAWHSIVAGNEFSNPFQAFLDDRNKNAVSALDYFNGLSTYMTKTLWDAMQ